MQDRPTKIELLHGISEFLMHQLRPAVDNPALSFRVLIAANLASIIAGELQNEGDHDARQLERLQALMPDVAVTDAQQGPAEVESQAAIAALNKALVSRIQAGGLSDAERAAIWTHLHATLREKLSVLNPRFDLSPTID